MGQSQSLDLPDTGIDNVQIRRRERDEMRTTRRKRPEAKRRPDAFMKHTEAPNHIRPIREIGREREKDEGGFEGTFEIADLVKKKKPIEDTEDYKVDVPLKELPVYERSESETSSSDEDRGQYHFEVSTLQKDEPLSVTDPEAHPVIVEGECAVGKELRVRDQSPLALDFPVFRVEWYLGAHIGDAQCFSVHHSREGSASLPFRVPEEAVGKYILAKAYRNVEDQLHETQLASTKAGVYDPHIGGPRHTDYLPPRGVTRVCSTAVSGPALISDACAYVLLKCLARGAFTCAVKLRDFHKHDSYGEAFVPLQGSRALGKSEKKLPATLFVDNAGLFQLRYRPADVLELTGEAASGLGILGLDLAGLLGSPFGDGEGSDRRGAGRRAQGVWGDEAESDGPAPPLKVEELEKFSTYLDKVSVRPSENPNTIIVALEWRATDGAKAGKQDFLRFDVDPAVGRDNALYVIIGFQAAEAAKRFNQKEWERFAQHGDLQEAKTLIQNYLEAITRKTEETRPAFERMPTTPWSILNAPQRLT
ncbi:conserved hypothetical protein [Neospora caninum Liverpool]|uniref:Uncharacterized protein n=1 Tax=Neospora caninum (strain Liverpool) TaxID=572307 RepID=F0VRP1_NEOCL|nr:conserved hypothetical protein [Neospora caninum Liverpool]CBZ56389.1 conserved hypothetical protein [Neospora caninum Liverpool]CEL71149.1 TPA: hypothetical protein BN1204_068130 [Neospora caninum Liverpool]|eukprot:XP_003886414.1 conserved hypothetical protein [Neospora caninum Liverpool]